MKYRVASNQGHGEWYMSDQFTTEQEVLEYLVTSGMVGSEYLVLAEQAITLEIEEK